jgi:hypothetical protein
VLNPWFNQERFGGRPLGHPTDRMPKGLWDKSMLEKRETSEDAYGAVPRGSRDMVKAELLASQSPAVKTHTHGHSVFWPCHRERAIRLSWPVTSAWWAIGSEPIQGDEWGTSVALDTFSTRRNAGSPTGREPYGDGVLVVVDGVTPIQGAR